MTDLEEVTEVQLPKGIRGAVVRIEDGRVIDVRTTDASAKRAS